MSLRNLLELDLVSCSPTTTIRRAAELMEKKNVGAVLIVTDGKPTGLVTDRDIAVRCVSKALDCEKRPVAEIMTRTVATVGTDAGIYDVIQVMKEKQIRRVPIVDESGRAVGLLSFGDIFQLIGKEISDLTAPLAPEKPKVVKQAA